MDRRNSALLIVWLAVLMLAMAGSAMAEPDLHTPIEGSWINSSQFQAVFEVSQGYDNCSLMIDGISGTVIVNVSAGNISSEVSAGEGAHNWSVSCMLNGTSFESAIYGFITDLTPPSAGFSMPAEGAYLSSRNISVMLAVNDSLDPAPLCEIGADNQSSLFRNLSDGSALNLILNYGTHNLTGICKDRAGNAALLSRSFTLIPTNVSFEFSTDKTVYFAGEQINIISLSPLNTSLQIAIFKDLALTPIDVFTTVIGNTRTIFFRTFSEPGFYSVAASFDYFGYRQSLARNFTVRNNDVSVTASANVTNARKSEPIRFEASMVNNISAVNFRWDLNNDGTYETAGRYATYSFDAVGDKTVRLQADDGYNLINRSVVVHIKDVRRVAFIVLENKTDAAINNATVEINNVEKKTNESGGAAFDMLEGSYTVRIAKTGYYSRYNDISITSDSQLTYRLENRNNDKTPPVIYLLFPKEGDQINGTKLKARFVVVDASQFNCTVYYSEYSNWYQAIELKQNIQNNTETSVDMVGKAGDNYWKVECTDFYGNTGVSQKNRFVVNTGSSGSGSDTPESASETIGTGDSLSTLLNSIMSQLDSSLTGFKSISLEEEEVSDVLQVKAGLDQAKTDVQKLRRDLSNLQFSESSSEGIASRDDIRNQAQTIRDETISEFTITKKLEFTQYPTDQAVADVIERMIKQGNLALTARQKDEMIRQNTQLQSQFIAETSVWNLKLDYLSGRTESVTLVVKKMGYSGKLDEVAILEDIPKTIAQSSDELEFKTLFSVVEPDPLIKIQPDSQNRSIYYIRKELSPDALKDVNTIVMYTKLQEKSGNAVTGLATLVEGDTSPTRVFLIVIIIIALVVLYNSRLMDVARSRLNWTMDNIIPSKDLSGARELINLASQKVSEGNLKEARRMYTELSKVYGRLSAPRKKEIYPEITNLREEFDAWEITSLLKEGRAYLMSRDFAIAVHTYNKINKVYNRLSEQKRREIYPEINEFIGLMRYMEKK